MSLIETRVGGRFRLMKLITHGSFGDIYIAQNVQTNEEVAVKLEDNRTKYPQLIYEAKIIYALQGRSTGVPHLFWCGQEGDYNVLIMELLSDSLETILELCRGRFSLKTVLMIADQAIGLLEYIHNKGFIHRDISPENLFLGSDSKSHLLYMIDFGLAKRFRDTKTGKHIGFRDDKKLTGTAIYASLNTHQGFEQSRRDDLEALGYVFVYLFKGKLPWDNIDGLNKQERYDMIYDMKTKTSIEDLCKGMPDAFVQYFNHCTGLRFEEKPDYHYLRRIFKELFIREGFEFDYIYDWILIPMSTQFELTNDKISLDLEFAPSDEFVNKNLFIDPSKIESAVPKAENQDDDGEDEGSMVDQEQENYKKNMNNIKKKPEALPKKGPKNLKPIETEYLRTDYEMKQVSSPANVKSPKSGTEKKPNKDCNMF